MRALRWLTATLLAVEVVLVVSGSLAPGRAVVVLVAVEAVVLLLVVVGTAVRYHRCRQRGGDAQAARSEVLQALLPRLVARAVRRELDLLTAVARWTVRRPEGLSTTADTSDDGPGDTDSARRALHYGRDQVPLVWAFLVVTAVEVAVIELVVPWPAVRLALLLLGLYGMIMMTGFIAIDRTRPHVLSRTSLRLRCGSSVDLDLPLSNIAAVRSDPRGADDEPTIAGAVLVLGVGGRTQVTLTLAAPVRAGTASGVVSAVRIAVDDPAEAVARLRPVPSQTS